MGSYYTYVVGRIAGEVAVFDSQGPVVEDRSAVLCIATEKLEKRRTLVKIPGRDFEHFLVRHWLWGAITYVGRIAGEVAVFDSQGPGVEDRSALAALHGGS